MDPIHVHIWCNLQGMSPATIAATMLELQAHVDVTIDWAAMLITWLYVGRFPGTFTASVTVDRLSPKLALLSSSVLWALSFALIPYSNQYWVVSAVIAFVGACSGFISVGNNIVFSIRQLQ